MQERVCRCEARQATGCQSGCLRPYRINHLCVNTGFRFSGNLSRFFYNLSTPKDPAPMSVFKASLGGVPKSHQSR